MGWTKGLAGLAVALSLGVAGLAPGRASAGPVYDGKDVVLVVPNSVAGLMSRYARMIAPYIAKHSGAKQVRVENRTGAGGLKGTNTIWTADPDGMTIAFTNVPAIILAQLSDSPGAKFKATEFTYLGRAAAEPRVLAVGAVSNLKSIDEVKGLGRPFKYAVQGTDEDFYATSVLADALGFKMQAVTGYEGQADTALAAIKGDVDGFANGWIAVKPMVDNGEARVLAVYYDKRLSDLPDVPLVTELVSDPAKRDVLEAVVTILTMSRGFFGPPGMDPAATKEMRAAIEAALKDPELLAEAKKADMDIVFASGAEQQEKVARVVKASGDLTKVLKEAVAAIQ
ncbi:Bug family tripartite tricarboxylate transporter substrate binding protein [Propylenella binzhouense]|uniref:Tripartite-type tricarboxylate transporter receptor subunit TctC n=1 Tax=Propylenella binzhouense TaxID=2555902 RepID=A0A964T2K1_9HYPH|nr:tripartite tricarboxylate transporter substrate-binding protein [Propylenella binzhouense]MYZ47248.1 hypothetical protein [Propylenella binzhouense]